MTRPAIHARPLLDEAEPAMELCGPINAVSAVGRELGSSIPVLDGPAAAQPLTLHVTGPSGMQLLLAVRAAGDRAGVTIRFADPVTTPKEPTP